MRLGDTSLLIEVEKDGKLSGIGKSGNPHIMDEVTSGMIVGAAAEAIAGEGLLLTAGGIDSHIHFISPTQVHAALYSGITTMIGGGTGPADGTNATTCTPGVFHIARMLQSAETLPINIVFLGKGNCSTAGPLAEQIEASAAGLKLHEDWGQHACRHRLLSVGRGAVRCAGFHSHGHAQRNRLC